MIRKILLLCAFCLLNTYSKAQIKLHGTEFQFFANSFPAVSLPFVLGENEVVKAVTHENYERIQRRYAEMFLGIPYGFVNEDATEETPRKVPHFVGSFLAYQKWRVLVYYWYPSPPPREAQDYFELLVFDAQGGKVANQVIAGVWNNKKQFAQIKKIDKHIYIQVTPTDAPSILYKLTKEGEIVIQK